MTARSRSDTNTTTNTSMTNTSMTNTSMTNTSMTNMSTTSYDGTMSPCDTSTYSCDKVRQADAWVRQSGARSSYLRPADL